jgi:DNA-binding transcriptional ArsR family regulator
MAIKVSPLEARIVSILKDWYPITVEELRDELSLRPSELDRALKALMVKGIIAFEPLSDKTYIRLLVPEIVIESGRRGKGARGKRPRKPPEEGDSIMYA